MAARLGQGDLPAGGAAATLLLLVVALGVTPWLAVPLAVATYAGVVWLRSRRDRHIAAGDDVRRQQMAFQAALANGVAIQELAQRVAKSAVREQIDRILVLTGRVLGVMREDGTLAAAPMFNDRLLEPFHSLLTEYVRLSSRGVRSAGELLEKTEMRDLPMIEQAVEAFYEQLHREHVIDLATLGEVLELNLESIRATTPRRFTP